MYLKKQLCFFIELIGKMEVNTKTKMRLGKIGEDKACEYLEKKAYIIMERNFRCKTGEIDIIACREEQLCFVEVKTRSSIEYGFPSEAVDRKKRKNILCSAKCYLMQNTRFENYKYRIDIIEVLAMGGRYYIHHMENAFEEGDK